MDKLPFLSNSRSARGGRWCLPEMTWIIFCATMHVDCKGALVRHPLPSTPGRPKDLVHCHHVQRRFIVQASNLDQLARRVSIHSCQ
jgi:hypothetical protein